MSTGCRVLFAVWIAILKIACLVSETPDLYAGYQQDMRMPQRGEGPGPVWPIDECGDLHKTPSKYPWWLTGRWTMFIKQVRRTKQTCYRMRSPSFTTVYQSAFESSGRMPTYRLCNTFGVMHHLPCSYRHVSSYVFFRECRAPPVDAWARPLTWRLGYGTNEDDRALDRNKPDPNDNQDREVKLPRQLASFVFLSLVSH
jgi:hypothetical protein